jgi:TRAP-type C4-dicarboxylate transport system permease small subunit
MGVIEHFIFCFVYVLYISCMYINIFNIYSFMFIPIPKFDFHKFFTIFYYFLHVFSFIIFFYILIYLNKNIN